MTDTKEMTDPKETTEYRVSIQNRFGKVESSDNEVDLFEKLQKLEEEKELKKKNSQKPKKPRNTNQQNAEQKVKEATAEKPSDDKTSSPNQPLASNNSTESKTVPPPKKGYREFRRGGVVRRPTYKKPSETGADSAPVNSNERPSKPFRGRGNGGFRGGRGTFRKQSEPRENVLQNDASIKEDVPTSPDTQSNEVTSVLESPSKVDAGTTTSERPRKERGVYIRGGFSKRSGDVRRTTEESTNNVSVNNDEKPTQVKPFRGNGGFRRGRGTFRKQSEHPATENVLRNKSSNEEVLPISPEIKTNEVNVIPENAPKVDGETTTSERPRMNRGTFRRGGFSKQRGVNRNATTESSESISTPNDERPNQMRSFRGRGRGRGGFRKVTEGVNENTSQDNNSSAAPNFNESTEMTPVDANNGSEAALVRKRESRRGELKNGVWTVRKTTDEGTDIVSTNVDESPRDNQPFRGRGRGQFRGGRGGARRGPVNGDHRFVQQQDQVGEPSVHDSNLQNGETKSPSHSKFSNKKFEPREPREKEFTLDEWRKMEESKRFKTTFDVRTANEGGLNEKWKDMVVRKKDEDIEENKTRSKNVKKQEAKLEFDYKFNSKITKNSTPESNEQASVPNFSDLNNFPGLTKH